MPDLMSRLFNPMPLWLWDAPDDGGSGGGDADGDGGDGGDGGGQSSTTQDDQLGDAGRAALQREREARKAAEKRAKQLEELADKQGTERLQAELAAAKKDAEDARAEVESAKLEALRIRVGNQFGLPDELTARLAGKNEAEIKKDAEALSKALGAQHGGFDGGARGSGANKETDMNTIIRRAAGRA
jgi:hypothetical protein